jgi:hypothetical protein
LAISSPLFGSYSHPKENAVAVFKLQTGLSEEISNGPEDRKSGETTGFTWPKKPGNDYILLIF